MEIMSTVPQSTRGRRRALRRILAGWTAMIVLPAFYVIGRYLIPPLRRSDNVSSVVVGKVGEIPPNTSRIVKLGMKPVILVHTQNGEYRAFSAICTHLGCTVEYRAEGGGLFHCNCHGGQYDLSGKNIAGPPPRPLTPYHVSIQFDKVIVSTTSERSG